MNRDLKYFSDIIKTSTITEFNESNVAKAFKSLISILINNKQSDKLFGPIVYWGNEKILKTNIGNISKDIYTILSYMGNPVQVWNNIENYAINNAKWEDKFSHNKFDLLQVFKKFTPISSRTTGTSATKAKFRKTKEMPFDFADANKELKKYIIPIIQNAYIDLKAHMQHPGIKNEPINWGKIKFSSAKLLAENYKRDCEKYLRNVNKYKGKLNNDLIEQYISDFKNIYFPVSRYFYERKKYSNKQFMYKSAAQVVDTIYKFIGYWSKIQASRNDTLKSFSKTITKSLRPKKRETPYYSGKFKTPTEYIPQSPEDQAAEIVQSNISAGYYLIKNSIDNNTLNRNALIEARKIMDKCLMIMTFIKGMSPDLNGDPFRNEIAHALITYFYEPKYGLKMPQNFKQLEKMSEQIFTKINQFVQLNRKTASDLQYASDTILIDKISQLDINLVKQAGLFQDFGLNSVSNFIKNFVQKNISPDAPGGVGGGVLKLILSGVLFKINPLIWVLSRALKAVGFDIDAVVTGMVDKLRPKLEAGEKVTSEEVTSIGKDVVNSVAGPLGAAATNDMLHLLRKMDENKEFDSFYRKANLQSLAIGKSTPDVPWLGTKGGSFLDKIFGRQLLHPAGRGKLKWLLGGLIVWTIKTALLGAGLIAGASVISGLLGGKEKPEEPKDEPKELPYGEEPSLKIEPEKPAIIETFGGLLEPSGKGTKKFKNIGSDMWVVPVIGPNVESTVLAWTFYVYPKLGEFNYITRYIPSFQRVVGEIEENYSSDMADEFIVPEGYHSIKQIVDEFAEDAAKEIRDLK